MRRSSYEVQTTNFIECNSVGVVKKNLISNTCRLHGHWIRVAWRVRSERHGLRRCSKNIVLVKNFVAHMF